MNYRSLQGRCGCFCGNCEIYIAYSTRDKKTLERIARDNLEKIGKAVSPEKVKCLGCKGQTSSRWNSRCEIRSCADDRGLEFCYQCSEYPCPTLEKHFDRHPEACANLKTISKIGPDAWVSSMLSGPNH